MMLSTRLLFSLVLLAGGLAGVGSLPASVLQATGWQVQAARNQEPAPEGGIVIMQRIKAKDRLIVGMLDGERGLFETAAWFRDLNASPSEYPGENWRHQPGRCEGEKHCRQVIYWVLAHLQNKQPRSQVEARIRQLEEELEQHINLHGTVILP